MPFVKIIVHAVWGTKNRFPFLTKGKKHQVIEHIKQTAIEKKIHIDCIDGHTEHLHAVISLSSKQNIADVMQQIKGESSFRANNKTNLFDQKFEWADEYYAVSVSESQLPKVRNYIYSQEKHHKNMTFGEEYAAFMKKHEHGLNPG